MLDTHRLQDFAVRGDGKASAGRVAALRAEMRKRNLDAFYVPHSDEHQSEYLPARDERLAWLTGFTGSAGAAVVMKDRAAIFVDGRYTIQVAEQADLTLFEHLHLIEQPPHEWLGKTLKPGQRLGYDPWLHTPAGVALLHAACEKSGAELVALDSNPLDAVWKDQPPPPLTPVIVFPDYEAGETQEKKRARIAAALKEKKAAAAVLTMPESICWLLNIRGADIPHTPFTLAFAVLHADASADLFIDERKLNAEVRKHLGEAVRVRAPGEFGKALAELGARKLHVQADPATAAAAIFDALKKAGAEIVRAADPCLLPKACKNETELAGIRRAHVRDGAALSRFLCFMAREAPKGRLTEIDAAKKLEDIRRENNALRDLSFDTISGAGPNAALPHYRVSEKSNRPIRNNEIYLVDSGGQYLDGTTDVTRTIVVGTPTPEQRDRFTRVLKGHIALAMARFPEGTTGAQLDTIARMPLWEAGLDYDHGTGHGVGHYLSVHEGPQSISKRPITQPLKPGMVCSNEPGFYKTGEYGIRIENLVEVRGPVDVPGGDRKLLYFETITLAPIDLNLVEPKLLSQAERDWLNAYHKRVREELSSQVDDETRAWLKEATRPI